MSKNKQLTELFIEELGQVSGGCHGHLDLATTQAVGEEGDIPFPNSPRLYTSFGGGEEGGIPLPIAEEPLWTINLPPYFTDWKN